MATPVTPQTKQKAPPLNFTIHRNGKKYHVYGISFGDLARLPEKPTATDTPKWACVEDGVADVLLAIKDFPILSGDIGGDDSILGAWLRMTQQLAAATSDSPGDLETPETSPTTPAAGRGDSEEPDTDIDTATDPARGPVPGILALQFQIDTGFRWIGTYCTGDSA